MKPFNLKPLFAATLIGIPALTLAADGVSYTYLELDYVVEDIDLYENEDFLDNNDDGDGYQVEGSLAFTSNFFGFARYSQTEADITFFDDQGNIYPEDEKVKTLTVGLGYAMPLNDRIDLVARAAYMDMDYGDFAVGADETDLGGVEDLDDDLEAALDDLNDDASDGYSLDVGLRSQMVEWLELGGGVRYTDFDSGDDFGVFGNALFEINPNLGINLSADVGDSLTVYRLGVRYSFAAR